MKNLLLLLTTILLFTFCSTPKKQEEQNEKLANIDEDSLLNLVQYQTFQYFWEGAEPNSGLARERFHEDD
ncbi:MAG: beta-glucosidase, partial [Bacteroidetes bacterium]